MKIQVGISIGARVRLIVRRWATEVHYDTSARIQRLPGGIKGTVLNVAAVRPEQTRVLVDWDQPWFSCWVLAWEVEPISALDLMSEALCRSE